MTPPDRGIPLDRRHDDKRLGEIERKIDHINNKFDTLAQVKALEDKQTEVWRQETREAISEIRLQLRGNGRFIKHNGGGNDLLSKLDWQHLAIIGGGIGYVLWEVLKR